MLDINKQHWNLGVTRIVNLYSFNLFKGGATLIYCNSLLFMLFNTGQLK